MVFKTGKQILFYCIAERETFFAYVEAIVQIQRLGYDIQSVTSDKNGSLISAVEQLLPDIPHQYCLVHIQRSCTTLLTRNPQTEAGVELKELVTYLNHIKNANERNIWVRWFERLYDRHEIFLKQRTYFRQEDGSCTWWYTHRSTRKAYRLIHNSLDHMFLYLCDLDICKDTNGLEADFTYLKAHVRVHRGLRPERRKNLILWYLYFKSKEKMLPIS